MINIFFAIIYIKIFIFFLVKLFISKYSRIFAKEKAPNLAG